MECKLSIIGYVGQDAELKETSGGKKVCTFTVATTPYKDKTVWVKVNTWDKQAETHAQYVKKGTLLKCTGDLNLDDNGYPRVYEASDGTTKAASVEITSYDVRYLKRPETTEPVVTAPLTPNEIPF